MGRILSSLGTSDEIKKLRKKNKESRKAFRDSDKSEQDLLTNIQNIADNRSNIKQERENRRMTRLAARKFGGDFEKARDLRKERVKRRKEFLMDFASRAATGEQGKKIGEDYEGPKSYEEYTKLKDSQKKSKDMFGAMAAEAQQAREAMNSENKLELDNKFNLGSFSLNTDNSDFSRFLMNDKPSLTSPNNTGIEEDSTPQSAMMKLYNKKRGR